MTEKLIKDIRIHADKGEDFLYGFFIDAGLASEESIHLIKDSTKQDIISEHYPFSTKMRRKEYEFDGIFSVI